MKRAVYVLTILVAHVVAVLVMVRVVRFGPSSLGGDGVMVMAAFAYGLPFIGAIVSYLRWPLPPAPRIGSRFLCYGVTAVLSVFGHGLSLFTLQQSDIALTERYREAMRERLSSDARFQQVRLGSYSCDYVLFPYITVHGDVATDQDHKDLESILWSSHAPVFRSAFLVSIAGQRPSRRPTHER